MLVCTPGIATLTAVGSALKKDDTFAECSSLQTKILTKKKSESKLVKIISAKSRIRIEIELSRTRLYIYIYMFFLIDV